MSRQIYLCNKMSIITYLFIAVALIGALHCAPVEESSVKSPSATGVSAAAPANGNTKQDSSEESKESDEHKRPSRDTENISALPPPPATLGQTPQPTATKEVPKTQPQAPVRDTRDTEHEAAISPAVISAAHAADASTSSSTTARSSY